LTFILTAEGLKVSIAFEPTSTHFPISHFHSIIILFESNVVKAKYFVMLVCVVNAKTEF